MNEKDFSDLGKEIGEKIDKFVKSDEIKELQQSIKTTVAQTMGEVKKTLQETATTLNENYPKNNQNGNQRSVSDPGGYGAAGKKWGMSEQYRNKTAVVQRLKRRLPVVKNPGGSISGILFMIFGIMGSVSFWSATAIIGLMGILTGAVASMAAMAFGIVAPLALLSTAMAVTGGFLHGRAKRFKSYTRVMGERDFYSIRKLSEAVNKKEKYVIKDIKKMIRRKWFKEGHLDDQETCFILTDEAYGLYLQAQRDLVDRQAEAARLEQEAKLIEDDPGKKQLKLAVEEGREYIRRIRKVNEEIPGEEISNKLYRLEKINVRIFEYVEKNPSRLPDIRKFMNYYLPTTLKLVESYAEFSAQPVQGENIRAARKEIEEMLDDINNAFEKMFDKLFEDDAMDISTDISVLSAMLAQEGLLEDEFEKSKKEMNGFAPEQVQMGVEDGRE